MHSFGDCIGWRRSECCGDMGYRRATFINAPAVFFFVHIYFFSPSHEISFCHFFHQLFFHIPLPFLGPFYAVHLRASYAVDRALAYDMLCLLDWDRFGVQGFLHLLNCYAFCMNCVSMQVFVCIVLCHEWIGLERRQIRFIILIIISILCMYMYIIYALQI